MMRTQISLTAEQKDRLDRESAETGLSLAELIRRAIDRCYGTRDRDADLDAIDRAVGAWRDREVDGEGYVEGIRTARRPESW